MTSSHRTPFLTIRAEGVLLPVDLLQRIVENDAAAGDTEDDAGDAAGAEGEA